MNSAGLAPSDPTTPSERRAAEAAESYPPDLPTQPDRRSTVPVDQPLPPVDEALAASAEPGPLLASGATADVFALDDAPRPAPLPLRCRRRRRGPPAAARRRARLPRTRRPGGERTRPRHGAPARPDAAAGARGRRGLAVRRGRRSCTTCTPACTRSRHPTAGARTSPARGRWSRPDPSVVHLDLHPGNVFLTESHGPAPGRLGQRPHRHRRARRLADRPDHRRGRGRRRRRVLAGRPRAPRGVPARRPTSTRSPRSTRPPRCAPLDPSLVPGERELVPAAAVLVRRPGRGRRAPLTPRARTRRRPPRSAGRPSWCPGSARAEREAVRLFVAGADADGRRACTRATSCATHSARWQAPTCVITLSSPPLVPSGKNVVHCASPVVPPMFTAAAWQWEWSLYEQPATEHSATAGMSIRVLMSTSVGAVWCVLLSTVDPSRAPCIGRKAWLTRRSGPQFR